MAPNIFATILHRTTNKITLILVYAVLEWTLISFILLNSLFSYLIIKFANYFGLKPPCLWCSRIDHFFEQGKGKIFHRDLLCEAHATEISKLGYCSNHQKLAAYQNMCEDCSSSRPDFHGVFKNFNSFPLVKKMIHNNEDKVIENVEESLKCSCCYASLERQIYSPYVLINPSNSDDLEYNGSDLRIDHFPVDHEFEIKSEKEMITNVNGGYVLIEEESEEGSSVSVSKFELKEYECQEDDEVEMLLEGDKEFIKEESSSEIMEDLISDEAVCSKENASSEIQARHLEFSIDCSGQHLVPVDLIDLTAEENEFQVEENKENCDHQETKFPAFESMEMEDTENSLFFHAKECESEYEQVATAQATQTPSVDNNDVQEIAALDVDVRESIFTAVSKEVCQMQINESEPEAEAEYAALDAEERELDVPAVCEEVSQIIISETKSEVSIGTEIPDLDSPDETQTQDIVCFYEDPSTSCTNSNANLEHGSERKPKETFELRNLSIELCSDHAINNQFSLGSVLNGTEEEKLPYTPTSLDSLHNLRKKMFLLERKDYGIEDSLDGSVISEFEGGDGIMTVEGLSAALRAERKSLNVIYAELEEERSASAISAKETMAMINRLQEEKAAMQMEALQYQRMMEEQAEYDQEALQLMNELMGKREREKQELEKELEFYRKKIMDYETKEKIKMVRKRSGFLSDSGSNGEDSDGISVDLNQEVKEEDQENGNCNTPVDAVIELGVSFGEFEEERMSILGHLRVLEDKLFALSEDEQRFEDARSIEHSHQENGNNLDGSSEFCGEKVNGVENGNSKEMNGKNHQEGRINGLKAKSLLPLFDATNAENGELNGHENGIEYAVTRFELEDRRVAIEEEVDQLNARMHALETDKEFLKHCIRSLKKGDKGVDLLQEILRHLRDLRNMELRVRNFSDGTLLL